MRLQIHFRFPSAAGRWFVIAAVFVSAAISLQADGISGAFDQANQLYEQGKFADAAAGYESLLKAGHASAALYFNLGNALFKSGEVGRSILNYRLAQRLTPRDPDLRKNLRLARAAANSGTPPSPGWLGWRRSLTLNELTGTAASAFWAMFILLAARQLWPNTGRVSQKLMMGCGILAVLLSLCLAEIWYDEIASRPGVVVRKEAVVRLGPFEESQSAFVLRDGTEVKITDVKTAWLQIKDTAGRSGWVRRDQIAALNPLAS